MNVGNLIRLLRNFPNDTPVKVLSTDGVEELAFSAPYVTRVNRFTPEEFVAINVVVED